MQRLAAAAVLAQAEGRGEEAIPLLRAAADLEDATEKSPVTPGGIVPMRELLGDLLRELGKPGPALAEYRHSLANAPNRFRSLYGAGKAAAAAGALDQAGGYFRELARWRQAPTRRAPKLPRQKPIWLGSRARAVQRTHKRLAFKSLLSVLGD